VADTKSIKEKESKIIDPVLNDIGETLTSVVWTVGILVDLLIEKGVVTKDELTSRLNTALEAAMETIKEKNVNIN